MPAIVRTICFLFFLILVASCSSNGRDSSAVTDTVAKLQSNDTANVETSIVQKINFTTEIWCNGSLQAGQKAIVPFEVQGNLLKVLVQNGQWVAEGQLLGQIDDYRQQHALAQAEINHRQALINYNDQLLLSGYNSNDTASLPDQVKSGAMLRSGLLQARLELNKARRELSNTRITAPVSGIVAGLLARPFTPSSEYKNFCTLLNTREMTVIFDVLEHDAALIQTGTGIEVFPLALSGQSFRGKISGADPMVGNHGTLTVSAVLPNTSGKLMDGMKVKVVVKNVVPNQLVIPKQAVLARQNRQVVFTVEDGHAIWNYVVTGYENSTHYTINEGLKPGQQVIVSNNLTLGHQAPVLVSNPVK